MRIGVLALQGDIEEHEQAIRDSSRSLGFKVDVVRVKRPGDLKGLSGILIPGGESTTIWKLSQGELMLALRDEILNGLPAMGTCAGAIFMAKEVKDRVVGETGQGILGLMDMTVIRNYYGRQRESFEMDLNLEGIGSVRAVFIRAPAIVRIWGKANALSELNGTYPAVIQDNMLALTFHPELTTSKVHEWFLRELVLK
ncbi:pyridoxal 5'-phosphate synthase glutaminase subunit PdxT [Candidatus Korarchaeum cryptofilum]|uniref:Pyridoxal 5'-phosphate synthase subunit PdxT n=1 Tax=Korarchaeum cryptofilum (strain OPF8) TaxID=374847 RepID=PDXT_KORCO|nr:pyridoxal 5'-phosphate synthase glutaminase subunit PdxT [Candidatus Korarchaeum cryptofilum]B1L4Z3.1 RecName: Full=Pyridoxal 5'-phosphate synthase subunit PdxT; AltName: Full=Pdx2; AltName: Full=Pyridoxal 5'-phosphate synthase glutaminase subunit [Candidatus Korarchaeum cryptofilum OPF8]ACB07522.1 SNO glutamine amidotransferase [Candidatus Korarchaeum cryptofilum OPF8]